MRTQDCLHVCGGNATREREHVSGHSRAVCVCGAGAIDILWQLKDPRRQDEHVIEIQEESKQFMSDFFERVPARPTLAAPMHATLHVPRAIVCVRMRVLCRAAVLGDACTGAPTVPSDGAVHRTLLVMHEHRCGSAKTRWSRSAQT